MLGHKEGVIGVVNPRTGIVDGHAVIHPVAHEQADHLMAFLLQKPCCDAAVDAAGKTYHYTHGAKLTGNAV